MMKRFRQWLFDRFLPAYVPAAMREHIQALEAENDRLRAYIRGVEAALRLGRRVNIRNEVTRHGHDSSPTASQ